MNGGSVCIRSSDATLRTVLERWLINAGYSIVGNGGALTIVDDETAEPSDDIDNKSMQRCLHLVYTKKKGANEIERPFTRNDFLTAVSGCIRESEDIINDIVLDKSRLSVSFRGGETSLTEKEFEVLELLSARGSDGATYEELFEIAGSDTGKETNAVQVYIYFLRTKLEQLTGSKLIRTIRGHGYALGKM